MANEDKAVAKGTKIKIGPQELTLRYSMYSFAQFGKLTGKSLLGGEFDLQDAGDLIAIIWAGTLDLHGDIMDGWIGRSGIPDEKIQANLKMIGREIRGDKLVEVAEVVGRALEEAFASEKSKEAAASAEAKPKNASESSGK